MNKMTYLQTIKEAKKTRTPDCEFVGTCIDWFDYDDDMELPCEGYFDDANDFAVVLNNLEELYNLDLGSGSFEGEDNYDEEDEFLLSEDEFYSHVVRDNKITKKTSGHEIKYFYIDDRDVWILYDVDKDIHYIAI